MQVTYMLRCYDGCGDIDLGVCDRPDLEIKRHTRETGHTPSVKGLPIPSVAMSAHQDVQRSRPL